MEINANAPHITEIKKFIKSTEEEEQKNLG